MTHDVLTMGVFDGVHRGHRVLISQAKAEADKHNGKLIVITFNPHPKSVLFPDKAPKLLCDIDDRVALLKEAGADDVIVLEFNAALAATEPEDFAKQHFPDDVKTIVIGENFRFGKGAKGDASTLQGLGYETTTVELAGDATSTWSSTFIRTQLAEGDVKEAAKALGRNHWVSGTVVHGDKRGRELGFPTANLAVPDFIAVPKEGVYAGHIIDGNITYPAAISIGTNPQFHGTEFRVEAYAIDQEGLDLYDHHINIAFVDRIRDQATFPSLEAFIAQMHEDVKTASELTK